ncbi:MAG: metallophosphoesterase, partial [Candidatus Andersenbacteria bacterium]|nr:metallophosphoesterase [Candidatus Andersenbacteria bacterium]
MKLPKFLPPALAFSILAVILAAAAVQSTAQVKTLIATPPNFLVAFIGDQGLSDNARAVLELIRDEGADMVIVSGDLGYNEGDSATPARWDTMITDVLGNGFPLFASQGNHDTGHWSQYRQLLQARLNNVSGETCSGDLGVQSTCTYQGLTFTSTYGRADASYIRNQHTNSDSLWTICSWHHNQQAMQVGGNSDEVGWGPYEACREAGAIVATAHEHSYHRTKTLTSLEQQTVDPTATSPTDLRISPGSTFAFVSGAGGANIRDQERCLPSTAPYGCQGEWANIYTSTQGAKFGALFMHF